MSTAAQAIANRENSRHSTGPRTTAGKESSSRNALTCGLFTLRDFVRPQERDEYARLCAAFQADLNPQGALEETFVMAIIGATWRLRRCSLVEAGMAESFNPDPMEDEIGSRIQRSVDRARGQAFSILRHSTAELRRLQTARAVTLRPSFLASSEKLASNCAEPVSVPRSAPCPCGSGAKYKRCCGTDAAPVLN